MNRIFSLARARSSMIFVARNSLRRWSKVTVLANLVRKVASSMAVSPPPTTTMSFPRKKNPSQVAQVDTPCPSRCFSDSMPSMRADAPAATIRVSVSYVSFPAVILNGRLLRSAAVTAPARNSVPKRWACLRAFSTSSGPRMPSGKPGKFSTRVVRASWPPGSYPSKTMGLRSARAAYIAAVSPAHPLPIMITFSTDLYLANWMSIELVAMQEPICDCIILRRRGVSSCRSLFASRATCVASVITLPHNDADSSVRNQDHMATAINPFRLLSELIMMLLGALLILLAISGRFGLPRPVLLVGLGAFLIYWGVRAAIKPEPGLRPYESRTRAASLGLVGLSVLAIPMLPLRLTPVMLGTAGAILLLRGPLSAIFSLRRN